MSHNESHCIITDHAKAALAIPAAGVEHSQHAEEEDQAGDALNTFQHHERFIRYQVPEAKELP